MDVSQVKQDVESPFSWGPSYKGEKTDDFARHLSEKDDAVAAYEPKEKVRAKDRDDRIEDDDRVETAEDDIDPHDDTSSDAPVKTADAAPIAGAPLQTVNDPKTATAQTTVAAQSTVATPATTAQGTDTAQPATATAGATNTAANQGKTTGLENATSAAAQSANQTALAAISAAVQKQAAATTGPKAAPTAAAANVVASASTTNTQKTGTPIGDTGSTVKANGKSKTSNDASPLKADAAQQNTTNTPTVKTEVGTNALEKMRADEMSKMSEKEVLTSTISELLAKGKGKITTTAAAGKTSAGTQGAMVSGNNAMIAATPTPTPTAKTDTAIGMVTQSALQAEMPIIVPNGDLGTSLIMPQQTPDANLPTSTAVPGGAINGIEQTSTNSASQANMAGRAMTQAGSPAEQIATQITTAAKDGANQIKVQLHPADLGRVDIKLEMGHDGRIMAVITADNADSLDLLQQDSKQLEKALQDAGFDTGSDSLSFSLNQGDEQDGQENGSGNGTTVANAEGDDDLNIDPALVANTNSGASGLDIQV